MTETDAYRVGRYVVLEAFASGGMATVHYGRQTGPEGFGRIVAIKRMRADLRQEPQARAALLDEGRLAARVRHVNVVQTLDVVADGDELLLVLEFVTGESLDRLLKAAAARCAPLPEGIVTAIVSGTLRGLHAAHLARGEDGALLDLVHRDVSPHNILLDISGVPRVTDFGIAKARGRLQNTQTGHLKGKLAYVAPEQIHGESSPASDVFSTGIVLWECLALRRLFRGGNEAEVLSAVLRCQVPLLEGAHPGLMQIAAKALSRLPEQRYQSALEMAEALDATGLRASPSEISAWMRTLVLDTLLAREGRLRTLEQESYSAREGVVAPIETGSWRGRLGLGLGLGLGLLGVGALVSGGWWALRTPEPPAPPTAEVPVAVVVPAPVVVPEPKPDPVVVAPVQPESVDAGPPPLVVAPRPTHLRPAAKIKSDCVLPYTIDSNGRKRYKLQCL
jgi:serine/threonine-protein kinase